jgi:predicted Zn-dependent peptidase
MSHLARQEMYRDQTFGLDEMLAAIEAVTAEHVLKLADRFFTNGSLAVTVLGNVNGLHVTKEQLAL